MAEPTVNTGTGSTITFSSGFFAKIRRISVAGLSRPHVKTSHMGTTTWDDFIAGDLVDPGIVTVEILYNPSTTPPMTGSAETMTITTPGGTTIASSAFMIDAGQEIPLEDLMTSTLQIKRTGTITITPAA